MLVERVVVFGFEFQWGFVAEGGVEAGSVVEGFDVIEDHDDGMASGFWDESAEAFGLEGGPEGLHSGIVVTVGFAAHGGGCAVISQ